MSRLALFAVVLLSPLTVAAPVPKAKPAGGFILLRTGDKDAPLRLLTPDGEVVRDLPIPNATDAALSPAGDQVAVVVRVDPPEPKPGGPSAQFTSDVYLVPTDFDGKKHKLGKPVATGFTRPAVVWGGRGRTVYVSDVTNDPKKQRVLPGVVTVIDVKALSAAVDDSLAGVCVKAVSPDGERLLIGRLSALDKWEVELVHHKTMVRISDKFPDVEFIELLGRDTLLGWYGAEKQKPTKLAVFDLKADTVDRVELPNAVSRSELRRVWVSPDGKQALYETRPVKRGVDRRQDVSGPRPTQCRLIVAGLDGQNAKVILDTADSDVTVLDWR